MAPTPTISTTSAATQTKGPATLVIAGVLALALGGLGVATLLMGKKNPELAAKTDMASDIPAASESTGRAKTPEVSAQATLNVKPQENEPLPLGMQTGKKTTGGTSVFPQEDPSLK